MPLEVVCASHSPLMGYTALEPGLRQRVEAARTTVRDAALRFDPELVVVFGPDHFNGFFYENMPPFCVGVQASSAEDYDMPAGDLGVPNADARALIDAVRAADIDVAISYRMLVDHGFIQTLHSVLDLFGRVPTIPIFINCAAKPLPSARRVRLLGDAVGRFLATLNRRVLVIGSGGLSHDPPTPQIDQATPDVAARLMAPPEDVPAAHRDRLARIKAAAEALAAGQSTLRALNPAWDGLFLSMLRVAALEAFDGFSDSWIEAEGGRGGQEVRTWIAACAALRTLGPYVVETEFYEAIPQWLIGTSFLHARTQTPDRPAFPAA